ncbi:MAG: hypothetical protein EBR93_00455 [Bacteroidetes bacterium]|nr:hypothetical protein [Bacteroidota bacterium]
MPFSFRKQDEPCAVVSSNLPKKTVPSCMKNMTQSINVSLAPRVVAATFFILSTLLISGTVAQDLEPPVVDVKQSAIQLPELYQSALGFDLAVNNFGFGIGVEYRRVIGKQMELSTLFRLAGLRDISEQTYTDIFFGQQVIPNKYQRVFATPLMIGLRQRFFAGKIQQDYRVFAGVMAGPVLALSIPYFDDVNGNGYREQGFEYGISLNGEFVNDVFRGWGSGQWHIGIAGEAVIGVDFSRNFKNLTSVEFGVYGNYFREGIQVMMPNQPIASGNPAQPFELDENGRLLLEPFFDAQKWFVSPQIKFTFGRLW